jgi:hypothetical protein
VSDSESKEEFKKHFPHFNLMVLVSRNTGVAMAELGKAII